MHSASQISRDSDLFAPAILRLQRQTPSPMPRLVLYLLLGLSCFALGWAWLGQLDIVAVAQGKIVPQGFLRIVQPAESGVVRDILVTDGQQVEGGQVLVRMDTHLSAADRSAVAHELKLKELQLRRIDAELSGKPLLRAAVDDEMLYQQVEAQYKARRTAYLDTLDTERALLSKAQQELKVSQEMQSKLQRTLPIYKEQAQGWERLANEGFAGRLMAMDRQRLYIESEQDFKAQAHNVESLRASIAQSEKRIAQITSNYKQQLHNERIEAAAQHHKLIQELDKQEHRFNLLELKAPQSGIVKDLATRTPGTVVAPGTILLTLVPSDEPLIAEVWINNFDAGFVRASQKARVKFSAYPFQKYGMLDGVVMQVSADAHDKTETSDTPTRSLHEAAYRALINLDSDYLTLDGQRLKILPGMLVNAEIHLGTRSVLEYVLSPIQKTVSEAGRER
jgi:membrane fusion protein, hemolysin D